MRLEIVKKSGDKISEKEFKDLYDSYDMKWGFEIFPWQKDNGVRSKMYKKSIQNAYVQASFTNWGSGKIGIELPRRYEGEFFKLLDTICSKLNCRIFLYNGEPLPQKWIDRYIDTEFVDLGLTRYANMPFSDENAAWLCIKSDNLESILLALNKKIHDEDTNDNALNRSWGNEIMILNPFNGWVILHGAHLTYLPYESKSDYKLTEDHYQKSINFVNHLSSEFGIVGFFMMSDIGEAAWHSVNGKLSFGFVKTEMENIEFGDNSLYDDLMDKSLKSISGKFCIDPDDYLYSPESAKKAGLFAQESYFSLF